MIKLCLLDLGAIFAGRETVARLEEAVAAIGGFETASGEPLVLGAIGDGAVLARTGIARFFDGGRVTSPEAAGARMPERRLLESAAGRAAPPGALPDTLIVSPNAGDLAACRRYGMTTVHWAIGGGPALDPAFTDWIDAPAVVAACTAPDSKRNVERAVGPVLSARHGLAGLRLAGRTPPRAWTGHAGRLVPLKAPELGPLDGTWVEKPVTVELSLAQDGKLADVSVLDEAGDAGDVRTFVASLFRNGQIALSEQAPPGATHEIVTDSEGRRRLVRRRFSAR